MSKNETASAKIFQFPPERIVRNNQPKKLQENSEVVARNRMLIEHRINETMSQIVPELLAEIKIMGFEIAKLDDVLDMALLTESLRSFLLKQHGYYHPFQAMVHKVFNETPAGIELSENIIDAAKDEDYSFLDTLESDENGNLILT